MRFEIVWPAPPGVTPEAVEHNVGQEITFRAQSGRPAYTGVLLAVESVSDGAALRLTLDLPDEAVPDELKATGPWSVGFDA